jgi:hypothetical protein
MGRLRTVESEPPRTSQQAISAAWTTGVACVSIGTDGHEEGRVGRDPTIGICGRVTGRRPHAARTDSHAAHVGWRIAVPPARRGGAAPPIKGLTRSFRDTSQRRHQDRRGSRTPPPRLRTPPGALAPRRPARLRTPPGAVAHDARRGRARRPARPDANRRPVSPRCRIVRPWPRHARCSTSTART